MTKNHRIFGSPIAILLTICSLLFISLPTYAKSLKSLFKVTNASVVLIQTATSEVADVLGQKKRVVSRGSGSGVVISKSGMVVTASHVVNLAEGIDVIFHDGYQSKAKIVSSSPDLDLAILQLVNPPKEIKPSPLADSDKIAIGEEIYIIGAPYGSRSLSSGIVSSKLPLQSLGGQVDDGALLQTDAAINPGNSGGGMFDMSGKLVGVVSHILTKSGGYDGIGFAVSSNTVKSYMSLRQSVWAGIKTHPLDEKLTAIFNVPADPGCLLVEKVAEGSISSKLGIRGGIFDGKIEGQNLSMGGDILIEFMSIPLSGDNHYKQIKQEFSRLKNGDTIDAKVLREGKVITLTTKI